MKILQYTKRIAALALSAMLLLSGCGDQSGKPMESDGKTETPSSTAGFGFTESPEETAASESTDEAGETSSPEVTGTALPYETELPQGTETPPVTLFPDESESPIPTVDPFYTPELGTETATGTLEATDEPTAETTENSAITGSQTSAPTAEPTAGFTSKPTVAVTVKPTAAVTVKPTGGITARPTFTTKPTATPTAKPTAVPTATPTPDIYTNSVPYRKNPVNAVDSLDRVVVSADDVSSTKTGKYVGIFYFLWIGEHDAKNIGPYDNHLIAQISGATSSEAAWIAAGGGREGTQHYWGKPMFGYYRSSDEWVMEKHVQMLTDADIDYVMFDCTNGYAYASNAVKFIKILQKYYEQGYDVPQVAFYTNTDSGNTMSAIYNQIYKRYPQYDHLWFRWNGKPLIVGNSSDAAALSAVKSYFTIKESQWPNDNNKKANGFPWMEFGRLLSDAAVYGVGGRKEVVNVSVAQHSSTVTFSYTAWYGANDRTRSWHNGSNDKSANAYLYGYNFAEQFEWALKVNPEMIFITGWNEWVAQRLKVADSNRPIRFIDCADVNTSRDIEPMEGGYGDNYYMQMISFIRRFKGTDGYVATDRKTIDINGNFSQWNDVKAYYKDYTNDITNRNEHEFGGDKDGNGVVSSGDIVYKDTSGRNDIAEMKVTEDGSYVYFFVKTVKNITSPSGETWMNLFIGDTTKSGWHGYNYVLNYKAPANGKLYLGKLANSDTYSVTPVSQVSYRINGNLMMVAIPKSDLGISGNAAINFKWSDNCTKGDIFGFYKTGDAAPIGRAGYYFGP